jgi:hypothetical protein
MSPSGEAKNVGALIGTPGLKLLCTMGTEALGCRGMFVTARDRLLVVTGNKLYDINTNDYSSITLGTLSTYTGKVSFAETDIQASPTNLASSQVMLVDGQYGYVLNTGTNVFTQVTGDYLPGTSIVAQNGFFIQNLNDSNKFIFSNYLTGLTWEASLNFYAAESSPDPILKISLLNNQLWLFGSKTVEIWNFVGDSANDQMWVRSGIGYQNFGIINGYCSTIINGHIFWIGSGPDGQNIVWHSGPSYAPERVSTHAIEYIITKMGKIDDCVALSYQSEGHQFVIFNFPSGNRTLCYDLTTGLWHERGDLEVSHGINNRHRAMFCVNWGNRIIVGDNENNNLYEWSLDQYTDNGKLIKRVRTCPHIHNERHRIFFHQLEIDLEKGVGMFEPPTTPEDPTTPSPTTPAPEPD